MAWQELVGSALSLWAVWLTVRRRMLNYPVGMLSVIVYGWIFVQTRLYSDALLQVVFAGFIVYGWMRWIGHLDSDRRVRVAPLPLRRAVVSVAIGVAGAVVLGAYMHYRTDAALPWLDATLAAFSLVAQFWQDRRHIAAWWLWIVVDVVYIGEYIYKDLRITAMLYAVFVALAVIGLRTWRQAARTQSREETTA